MDVWGRLNDVTDPHDPCVDFKWADILQEKSMETRRYKVQCIGILRRGLEVGDKLKAFIIECQGSGRREVKNLNPKFSDV